MYAFHVRINGDRVALSYRVGGVIMGDQQIRHREHCRVQYTGRPREEYHAELVSRDRHQKHPGGIEEQTSDVHSFAPVRW